MKSALLPAFASSVLAALATFGLPTGAHATLGGPAASVAADQQHLKARREAKSQSLYTVHEMTLPSGSVVREFESTATGKVFAVAWSGPFMPDLQQLLGTHFSTFVGAAGARAPSRGALNVNRPELVVHSGGHMRAFNGFAYLPDQLPEGVKIDELH